MSKPLTRILTTIAFLFILGGIAWAAAGGPEPDPWWLQVEKIQSLLLKWIAMLSAVALALVAAFFAVASNIKTRIQALRLETSAKIENLEQRQDRQAAKTGSLQEQVTIVAAATTPNAGPLAEAVKKAAGAAAIAAALALSGCAGSGEGGAWTPADTAAAIGTVERTYGLYDRYQNPQYYRPGPYAPTTNVIVP